MQYEREILDALRKIVQGLRASSRRAEEDLGFSGAQLFVLQILHEKKLASINELANLTRTHQSSVSAVVSKLVMNKLVQRKQSEKDARKLEVSLTARGEKLLKNQSPMAQKYLFEAIQGLNLTQQQQLAQSLNSIITDSGFSQFIPNLFFENESETYD